MEAERLKQALLCAAAQLESARAATHEELRTLECRALHLARLLESATRERDEARRRCRSLLLASSPDSTPALPAAEQLKRRPLPQRGALVEAVMKAGPLLQTLLLTGPLPQWQVPPPALGCHEIPPVSVSSSSASLGNEEGNEQRKRRRGAASSSSPESNGCSKYRRSGLLGI